jgi:hypothetical protein
MMGRDICGKAMIETPGQEGTSIGMRCWMIVVAIAASLPAGPVMAMDRLSPPLAPPAVMADATAVQTSMQSMLEDAAEYARQYDVPAIEAVQRLQAQEESVPVTDRLQLLYRDRLAGVFIEHKPVYRIVVLLKGSEPVADTEILAGGMTVPIMFRTGAPAARDEILAAIASHQADLRAALPYPPAMGVDPRSGTLALMVRKADLDAEGLVAMTARLGAIAGVPVQIRTLAGVDRNLSIVGGSRVAGVDPASGRRYLCTTGFVVTDGARTGVTTAAHCPDALSFIHSDKSETPLTMVGAWGARYQDVQIHVSGDALSPLFYADSAKRILRRLASWRNRTSTRAGDFVCHRGERTGYSCAEVEFVDYAPPADLCAGPCEPYWVAVRGPHCMGGDSGSPVFIGAIAFGTVKGASYVNGVCGLYFYMSTDYLPPGWTLLH